VPRLLVMTIPLPIFSDFRGLVIDAADGNRDARLDHRYVQRHVGTAATFHIIPYRSYSYILLFPSVLSFLRDIANS
jgi:hypothetical protein